MSSLRCVWYFFCFSYIRWCLVGIGNFMTKKIFISGASSGIGKYLADNLLTNYQLFTASRSPSIHPEITHYITDFRDDAQIISLANHLSKAEIDLFILNAGIGYFDNFTEISSEQDKEMIQVNLRANIFLIKRLLSMISSKAKLVFIGSVAGKSFFSSWATYQASKFGLRWFVWSLRKEIKNPCF